MPDNKTLSPPEGASGTGIGSGVMIGDGVMLTAGHVMYEFNERDNPASRQIRTLSGSSIYWDPRSYFSQYDTIVRGFPNPLPAATNPLTSFSGQHIESFIRASDIVFVTRGGDVGASDAGMVTYLVASDIVSENFGLVSGTTYHRWGATTGEEVVPSNSSGSTNNLALDSNGLVIKTATAITQPGDSGGANWIEFEGKEFITGNNVASNTTTRSFSSYISNSEFVTLNTMLAAGRTGNSSGNEPTNLIVGSSGADTNAVGTYRPDIILGKGGDDTIDDGDIKEDAVWANDLLYGGAGNDTFTAGNGDDLIHGGDHRVYDTGSGAVRVAIEDDGAEDTINLGETLNRDKSDPGVELRIGTRAGASAVSWVYGNSADQAYAIYAIDRHTSASPEDKLGTDALVSVEKVTLTGSNDIVSINELGTSRYAGGDAKGGVYTVTFGGNDTVDPASEDKIGDLVDASGLSASDNVYINLATGLLARRSSSGAISSTDILNVKEAESAFGGAGEDEIIGDGNANRLAGGDGKDTIDGGIGNDYIVSDDDNADDTLKGGDGEDTVIYKYDSGDGTIELGSSGGNGFGLAITVGGAMPFGADTLESLEKGAVEAGSGADTLRIAADGTGVGANVISHIDLGGGTSDMIDLSSWTTAGASIDLVGGTVSWAGTSITVRNAELALGGAGADTISASGSAMSGGAIIVTAGGSSVNYTLAGGDGADTLTGGSGSDTLYSNSSTAPAGDDNDQDTLIGGAGRDIFYVGANDRIALDSNGIALERGESVYYNGILLKGGVKLTSEGDVRTGPYKGDDGLEYYFNEDTGGALIVTVGAAATSSARALVSALGKKASFVAAEGGGGTLIIEDFRNGDGGIYLRDEEDEPDTDEPARSRDPLIIDLDGDRNVVRELGQSNAWFDLDNDGFREHVAWSLSGDGLLVRDLNGNGQIDNGMELFGSGYVQSIAGINLPDGTDGFSHLRQLDSNTDSLINNLDADFATLRVWVDANGDAVTDAGELKTLTELGIVSIDLRTVNANALDDGVDGSRVTYMSSVIRSDGTTLNVFDAYVALDNYDTREMLTDVVISAEIADLPFVIGSGTVSDLDVAMSRDAALEDMVAAFADLGIFDAGQIADLAEQILFRWTGADQIAEDSRGRNMNARWLHVIEQISGHPFVQGGVGANPRVDAASLLMAEYEDILAGFTAKLLGQTELGQTLLPGLTFVGGTFFKASETFSLSQTLAALADAAPDGTQEAIRYWVKMVDVLDVYAEARVISVANLDAVLNPILLGAGLPVSVALLRDSILDSAASELIINDTASRFFPNIDANRHIIADAQGGVLRGSSLDTRFVIGRVDGELTIESAYQGVAGSSSRQSILMTEHRLEDFAVSADFVVSTHNDLEGTLTLRLVSQVDNTIVEIPGMLTADGYVTPVFQISFAGGGVNTTHAVTDLIADGLVVDIPNGQLIFGAADTASILEGGSGNDLLLGFGAGDEYRFGPGGGQDKIIDRSGAASGDDSIVLQGVRADYRFEQTGDRLEDLRIVHVASGDSITVIAHFSRQSQQVELFRFDDGSTLTADALALEFTTGTPGDDTLTGSFRDDVVDGGGGADVLDGRAGADRYLFETGDGASTIADTGTDAVIVFGAGIVLDDIQLLRGGTQLAIAYGDGDIVYLKRSTSASPSPVARIDFDDGSSISFDDLVQIAIDQSGTVINGQVFGTPGSDTLTGTPGNDIIDGLGGRDDVNGGDGNDVFVFGEGTLRINDGPFTFDTLYIPSAYSINDIIIELDQYDDLRIRFRGSDGVVDMPNGFDFRGDRDTSQADDIEQILFEDGTVIDLSQGSLETGTAGNDVLIGFRDNGHPGGVTVFRPGAGDDYIFATQWNQRLELSSGFGHDVYFANYVNRISFTNIAFNGDTRFTRVGDDLVISFANAPDTLTVKRVFGFQDDADIVSIAFSNQTLTFQQIVNLTSVSTSGDDVLFGTTILDGGAGNDTLIGSAAANTYVFARGYGNDVIKEQDSYSGNPSGTTDTLTLTGLNRDDVTFSRDANDPLSIIITIKETGETLTLDGTPFDDAAYYNDYFNNFGGGYMGDYAGAHWIDVISFANGETMSQRDIEQALLDAEATDGNDVLIAFGAPDSYGATVAPAVLNGGRGDDIYENGFREVHVTLAANSGRDTIINTTDRNARTVIHLDASVDPSDVLVLLEDRDGTPVTVVRTVFGTQLTIEDHIDNGTRSQLIIVASDGTYFYPSEDGGLIEEMQGTDDVDYLVGALEFVAGGEVGYQIAQDDVFTPGLGDDVIAGRGGNDVVEFNLGDGADILLGDQAARPNGGEFVAARTLGDGSYAIAFGDGIDRDDIDLLWLDGLTDKVTVQIRGTTDSITVQAAALSELRFANGQVLSFDGPQTVFYVSPGDPAPDLTSVNETVIATGGDIVVNLADDAGRDLMRDRQFDEALAGTGTLDGWLPSRVHLLGGTSLDDFDFIRDTNNPDNLVIRNRATGAELTIQNQFALQPDAGATGWLLVDANGDGTAEWNADLDDNGIPDFARMDSNGDGTPDWITPDFNDDGQSDWQRLYEASLTVDGVTVAYAWDYDNDGIFEGYGLTSTDYIELRDTNADGVPDEFTSDGSTWTAVPTDAGGAPDWMAIDENGDGTADLAILDTNADGTPDWIPFYTGGTTSGAWDVNFWDELYDAEGNYVATRYAPDAQGNVFFDLGNLDDPQASYFIAQDNNGDLIPDVYGKDADGDDVPDVAAGPLVVADFSITLPVSGGFQTFYYAWDDIAGRVISAAVNPLPDTGFFDLSSLIPQPTAGVDRLRIAEGGSVDSLGGNDVILAADGYATLRFGRGDGHDVFSSSRDELADLYSYDNGPQNRVVLDGINSLSELDFARGGDGLSDLVITIRDTGDTLTIIDQFNLNQIGDDSPTVSQFQLANGQNIDWATIFARVDGASSTGSNVLITDGTGGLIDGGAGADTLRGGRGNDTYRFGRGYDEDVISDLGGVDTVVFDADITAADIFFSRTGINGQDLLVEIVGTERLALTIRGQFSSDSARIERFELADGSVMTWRDVQQFILRNASTGANDTITGFATDDRLDAGGGNDVVRGDGGADAVDGGAGRDIAVFRGAFADYEIVTTNGVTTVRDLISGRDGTDTLVNVEEVRFLGGGGRTVLLSAENVAPVVASTSSTGVEDQIVIISRAQLLSLATDANADTLTLAAVGDGVNATAWIGLDGNVRLRPTADFAGTASFRFDISDGNGGVASGQVTVQIAAQNDAPTVMGSLSDVSVLEDSPISIAVPQTLFSDVDGDALTLAVTLANGQAAPAWLTLANGRVTGTPPANFNGTLDLRIVASDGVATAETGLRVTILPVADAPVLTSPVADQIVTPGAAFTLSLTGLFSDPDGDVVTVEVLQGDGTALPAWLGVSGGQLSGLVPADFVGPLSLLVRGSDGSLVTTDVFALTAPSNAAPIVALPLVDVSSGEDAALDIAIPTGSFTDADGDPLTLTARLANGYALPSWLTFDGSRFTGTPPLNFNGNLDVTVTASDGSASVSDSFSLVITAVNDAPVLATPLADQSATEDAPFAATIDLGSFTDGDGESLSYSVSGLPSWLSFDADTGTFTGTATNGDVGSATITVTATDSAGASASDAFVISVSNTNDAPVVVVSLADQAFDDQHGYSFGLPAGSFADVDAGDTLVLSVSGLPTFMTFDPATGNFTAAPVSGNGGSYTITVTATDAAGASASDSFVVTVTDLNDAPILVASVADQAATEDASFSYTIPAGAFSDYDSVTGDVLSYSLSGLPAWLTFDAATRTLSGTPANGDVGTVTLSLTATDRAGASASDSFTVSVANTNDAPVIVTPLPDVSTTEDAPVNIALASGNFTDADGDALSLSAVLANGNPLPSWLGFDGVRFTGTPPANFNGSLDIVVTANDGTSTVSDSFTLTIAPVNDAPVMVSALPDQNVTEDSAFTYTMDGGAFSDVDGEALAFSVSGLPNWLSFNATTRTFSGTPVNGDVGAAIVTVTATDSSGASVSDSFTISVANTNDAPIIGTALNNQSSNEDTAFSFTLSSDAFGDVDAGDSLTLTAAQAGGAALPAWISFNASNRTFTGTPPVNFDGDLSIRVTATDSAGASATQTFTLDIMPVNDAPGALVVSSGGSVAENAANGTAVAQVQGTDPDAGAVLTYSLVDTAGGRFAINAQTGAITVANGTLLDYEAATSHAIIARVTDQGGLSRDLTTNITLTDVVEGGTYTNITGWNGVDILMGTNGADLIRGLGGRDLLFGDGGNDIIEGGTGADIMFGGAGADVFRYTSTSDAPRVTGLLAALNRDIIGDFQPGSDRIDLSAIDARAGVAGDQAFSFIGSAGFSGTAGQLRYAGGIVSGDVNGDRVADFEIQMFQVSLSQPLPTLSAADFVL